MDRLNLRQMVGVQLIRAGQLLAPQYHVEHVLQWSNPFSVQQIRNGKVIATRTGFNGITVTGKNYLLDVGFGNATPVTPIDPWYIGLINQSPTPVLVEGDTLASHSGWAEFTAYSGNRIAWDDADSVNKVKGTTTVANFVVNASGSVHGILIASVASGTSGTLWATGSFDSSLAVINTDELKITYGLRC